uniref:Band 7 domain-containing protein n=1 Tax=Corethron hystrix TaxID=216773 RepID=A0A7S1FTW3_9STRA|mmetsp:Transcript_27293/g.62631  ORF Transcript_27293/g.62631 Transcript_27293/m.62631 type:complete len:279 (+) Transcript_27293:294-1130(+)|eukprot:CAMPEP_0113309324 /NCGR_PEP_ID=MMETSP0010_2-20120614/7418_1 /TAXON_ID=216773 ORGANISM="Corethron hystrix, Strain 308" /NCGR_SAMPLE_ID=MMETSP0010_2 /ASSEMBLY_ACC=CAM_ASM_000155 /LENGTH=278 /DNA_ID=CAMNT_0000164563 /DNA_START=288 /DNA_END=1124 /DNA_ORIENTATION=- /assembly_acc=CAM_ASM_000155
MVCIPCIFCVSTGEVAIIEQCGKFDRMADPGCNMYWCPCEQEVGRLSRRVQQIDVRVETKTKDNVFIDAVVSVQFQVIREKAFDAFYALSNVTQQMTAHIYDVLRAELPNLELDAVFEAKEDLALSVKNSLSDSFSGYGYQIIQALITDLDPDQRVKSAMNEINSSKRLKFAVAEQSEGAKILVVKSAEAEAEAKYLSGVGVAKQRKAIVDGLRHSIVNFSDGVQGASNKDVMDLLLLTQYFDMVHTVGSAKHCKTVFMPSSKGANDDLRTSLLQASS